MHCIDSLESLSRIEHWKGSTVGNCKLRDVCFVFHDRFPVSRVTYYGTGTSTPSLCRLDILFRKHAVSPMFTNQSIAIKSIKRWISNTPTEGGDHSPSYTTAKENQ
jgi:hypothetical protein